jgi:hypothetical protein
MSLGGAVCVDLGLGWRILRFLLESPQVPCRVFTGLGPEIVFMAVAFAVRGAGLLGR